jgi:hypothetical protein
MAGKMRSGTTEKTPDSLFIGPGAVYKGFQDPQNLGTLIGATKGGNKVSFKEEWHAAEIDGALGDVKGASWLVGGEVKLEANLLEMTKENLLLTMRAAIVDTSDPDYDRIHHDGDITRTVHNDIAIVGELLGKQKPIIFVIRDAVNDAGTEVDTGTGKDDTVLKVAFTGEYNAANPTKMPYEIYYPKASVTQAP